MKIHATNKIAVLRYSTFLASVTIGRRGAVVKGVGHISTNL